MNAQSLNNKLQSVRSYFAAPHQALIKERGENEVIHRETFQRSDALQSDAEGLHQAASTVRLLSGIVSAGNLDQLQKLAAEHAASQAGNPFAFLGTRTRENLSKFVAPDAANDDGGEWNVAGALALAPALAQENPTEALSAALAHEYSLKSAPPKPEGVESNQLAEWSTTLGNLSADRLKEAELASQQASATWSAVEQVQEKLNAHWKARGENMDKRLDAAKDFLIHLDKADQEQPGILKEMRNQAPPDMKPFFPSGILDSYRAQLKRQNGDADKVDWKKMLKQMERTSFS